MSISTNGNLRSAHRPASAPSARRRGLGTRIALGIAGGLLVGIAIHLIGRQLDTPSTVAEPPASAVQLPQPNAAAIPPMVLTGVVRDAVSRRTYAVISVAGAPAREFQVGEQLADGVQLADIADDAVTVVGNGRSVRIALTYITPPVQADPRITTRSAADWRNASSARTQNEPASPPATIVAPPRGFSPPSSTSTDRAVWRARQTEEGPANP